MNENIGSVEKKIKKRKKKVIISIMIFLLAVSTIFALRTDFFNVTLVEIEGNNLITDDYILQHSGIIMGKNIFRLKLQHIDNALLSLPYIKNAEVKRSLPHTIVINVEERQRVASIPFMENYIIIDREGLVLESSPEPTGLLIEGLDILNFSEGSTLNVTNEQQLDKVLNVINELENLNLLMLQIDVTEMENIRLKISQYLTCKIGNGEKLDYKLKTLNRILLDLAEKDIVRGIIDISGDGYPGFKPVE